MLTRDMKSKRKAFIRYAESKLKSRTGIHDLVAEGRNKHITEKQKQEDSGPMLDDMNPNCIILS